MTLRHRGYLSVVHTEVSGQAWVLAADLRARLGLADIPILDLRRPLSLTPSRGCRELVFSSPRRNEVGLQEEDLMQVRRVDTLLRGDVRQFVGFPFELYRGCPLWVPPIASDMEFVLNRERHPFYRHSGADFFLAEEAGRTLGRLAVLDNRRYNEYRGSKTAFFYYFDAMKDERVFRALFEVAHLWARQRGLDHMVGPLGFVQGDSIGLLVEGFEHRPAMGIAYNYSYYDFLLREVGFEKKTDYWSGYLPGDCEVPQRFYDVAEKVKERRGFWIKSFRSKQELRQWGQRIVDVYNRSFLEGLEYYPVTEEEGIVITERLIAVADPRLIKLVMKGDEIVGFLFAFVDTSAAIQKTRGRVWPWGWITLLLESKRAKWVNFAGAGLVFGHRGVGANTVLYTELVRTMRQFNFEHADIAQVGEGNVKNMADMQAIGVQWYKKHRVYERSL